MTMGVVDATTLNETPLERVEMIGEERVEAKQVGNVVETTFPWKDQPGLTVKVDLGEPTLTERFTDKRKREIITETVDEFDGGFKVDILLNERPDTNVFCYEIEGAENYDFFYQPALTEQEIAEGAERPENIVGSYAVYHKTLKNHQQGRENYATGKVLHIPRPQVWELNNQEVTKEWAELSYTDDDGLCVTVRQEFLDKAEYPVRVDPTFGYTSIGASSGQLCSATSDTSNRIGSMYSLAESATVTEMQVYGDTSTGSYNLPISVFLNYEDGAGSGSHTQVVLVDTTQAVSTTNAWEVFTVANVPVSPANIVINYVCDGEAVPSGNYRRYHDSASNINQYFESFTGSGSYAASQESPWTETASIGNNSYSIYATYTASEDSPPFAEDFEDADPLPGEFDSDDSYGTGNFVLDSSSQVNGTYSARCDAPADDDGCALTETLTASTTYYAQMSIKLASDWSFGANGYNQLFAFGDGTGNPVYCNLENYGTARITCNGDEIGYIDTGIDVPINTITQLEFRVKISASTGDLDIWIDNDTEGSPDYNGSGSLNTGTQPITSLFIGGYNADGIEDRWYDDICIGYTFFGSTCFAAGGGGTPWFDSGLIEFY